MVSHSNHLSNGVKLEEVDDADKLPFYDVLKIRGGYRNKPDALTREQVRKLFSAIDRSTFLGIRDYAVYALMYNLGLSRLSGKVFNLDLEDVDLKKQKLTVLGKGKKRRELHLNDEMVQVLSEWLAIRHNFKNSEETKALFISKKGNPEASGRSGRWKTT